MRPDFSQTWHLVNMKENSKGGQLCQGESPKQVADPRACVRMADREANRSEFADYSLGFLWVG
jgi:hypothetical protein